MDVKSAFLYSVFKEEIYMRLPEGYRTARKVAWLHKCILRTQTIRLRGVHMRFCPTSRNWIRYISLRPLCVYPQV